MEKTGAARPLNKSRRRLYHICEMKFRCNKSNEVEQSSQWGRATIADSQEAPKTARMRPRV